MFLQDVVFRQVLAFLSFPFAELQETQRDINLFQTTCLMVIQMHRVSKREAAEILDLRNKMRRLGVQSVDSVTFKCNLLSDMTYQVS